MLPEVLETSETSEAGLRIVYRRLDTIRALPGNAKLHDEDDIAGSISDFGFIDPLGVNVTTGSTNLDGNGRVTSLKLLYAAGEPAPAKIIVRQEEQRKTDDSGAEIVSIVDVWYVPTVELEFDADTEGIVAARLNRSHDKAGYDPAALLSILEQAQAQGRLPQTGYDDQALIDLMARVHTPEFPPGSQDEQQRLDQQKPKAPIDCPHCGRSFVPA